MLGQNASETPVCLLCQSRLFFFSFNFLNFPISYSGEVDLIFFQISCCRDIIVLLPFHCSRALYNNYMIGFFFYFPISQVSFRSLREPSQGRQIQSLSSSPPSYSTAFSVLGQVLPIGLSFSFLLFSHCSSLEHSIHLHISSLFHVD